MANVIIGIHGLGNKPTKQLLEQWWKLAMIEGLTSIGHDPVWPKFELVYWADILHDKPLSLSEKDVDSPLFLNEVYVKAPEDFIIKDHPARAKIINYLNRHINRIFLNEDLSLNYSFISDTVINKYFRDLEIYYSGNITEEKNVLIKANELIRKRLYNKLQEHRNDNVMLISHSMGSIIAFDVLKFSVPDIMINTFVTIGSPLGLPVVISKIAAEQKRKGSNEIIMTTPPGITGNWFNFSDILDKVAFNYKLSDDFSENRFGVKPVDFLIVNNYEIKGTQNPHKSYGYLRAPEFSKILNEFILTERLTMVQKIYHRFVHVIDNLKTQISGKDK